MIVNCGVGAEPPPSSRVWVWSQLRPRAVVECDWCFAAPACLSAVVASSSRAPPTPRLSRVDLTSRWVDCRLVLAALGERRAAPPARPGEDCAALPLFKLRVPAPESNEEGHQRPSCIITLRKREALRLDFGFFCLRWQNHTKRPLLRSCAVQFLQLAQREGNPNTITRAELQVREHSRDWHEAARVRWGMNRQKG